MSEARSHSGCNNSSSNSRRNSLQTRLPEVGNEATGHPTLSQPTPQAAANPVDQEQTDTASQTVEENCRAYRLHHGYQRKYSKADVLLATTYDVDLRTTTRASALHTHEEVTHHNRTRH
jgi:hypothetical protein